MNLIAVVSAAGSGLVVGAMIVLLVWWYVATRDDNDAV